MYILTRKNRVIDYCEHGYLYVGTTVICPDKGKTFQDATIVYTDKELPPDIDCGSYEYINGEFIRYEAIPNIVASTISVNNGDTSTYPEGTLYLVLSPED